MQVGRTVLPRGRPHGDEHRFDIVQVRSQFRRERQPPRLHVFLHQRIQSRFVNRNLTALETFDFRTVDIHAHHFDAHLRKTGAGYQSDVSRSYNRYFHVLQAVLILCPPGALAGNFHRPTVKVHAGKCITR